MRASVEADLRADLRRRGLDPEVGHRAVLRALASWLIGPEVGEGDVDAWCAYELALEQWNTRPDPALIAQIAALRAAGHRVIAVSDMYLDSGEIDRLLRSHGITTDRVYASSDHGLSKFSGRLYSHVAATEGVAPSDIVHVGDDLLADIWSARSAGVRAVRWQPQPAPAIPQAKRPNDPAFRLGYRVLGPAFATAGRLLLRHAEVAGIDEIAFVARDGELFQRVVERLLEGAPTSFRPALRYVYLSRRATGASALTRLTLADVSDVLAAKATNRGLRTVFDAYNLDAQPLLPHMERLGIDDAAAPINDPAAHPGLTRLLGDEAFQHAVAEQARRQRALLRDYLAGAGVMAAGHRVAFADVGWRGTTQSSLQRAFGADPEYAVRRGYYLGVWDDGIVRAPGELDDKEGLLCDFRRGRTPLEGAAWYLAFVIEALSRAAHGTVLGYRAMPDGTVEPVLAGASVSRAGEEMGERFREPVRAGILASVEEEADSLAGLMVDERAARRKAQRALVRLAFFPTRREVELIAGLSHTESFAEDWHTRLVADPRKHPLRRPRAWLAGLQSPWRAGFVRMTGGYPLAAAFLAAESALMALPPAWRRGLRDVALRTAGAR